MKRNKNGKEVEMDTEEVQQAESSVQNSLPFIGWSSFDEFWQLCVKNGTPTIKAAAIAHLASMGTLRDQTKWVESIIHFGIKIEK